MKPRLPHLRPPQRPPLLPLAFVAAAMAVLLAAPQPGRAQAVAEPARRLGDHPAIVVQRLRRQAKYDYAAKFYPHPAWLWLVPGPDDATAAALGTAAVAASAPQASRPLALAPVSAPR